MRARAVQLARALRYAPTDALLMRDAISARRFWTLRHFPDARGTLTLRPRALGGAELAVRDGTSDAQVTWYVLSQKAHLPPAELGPIRSALDLGANIGVAAAHLAVTFPLARVTAVEPDPGNAEACRANTEHWRYRCEVVEGAAWTSAGLLRLVAGSAEDAVRVEPLADAGAGGVTAHPIAELVQRAAVDGTLDYLKMNIEGAEAELLATANEWAGAVRALRVELHEPYGLEQCRRDLEHAGFRVRAGATPGDPWVTALRI